MRLTTDRPGTLSCEVCLQHALSLEVIYVAGPSESLALCDGCVAARNKRRQRIAVIRDGEDPQRG